MDKITPNQINVLMALALIKHLFHDGKISEDTYKKIVSEYKEKFLKKTGAHDTI